MCEKRRKASRFALSSLLLATACFALTATGSEDAGCLPFQPGERSRVVDSDDYVVAMIPSQEDSESNRSERQLIALKRALIDGVLRSHPNVEATIEFSGAVTAHLNCGGTPVAAMRVKQSAIRIKTASANERASSTESARAEIARLEAVRASRSLSTKERDSLYQAYLRVGDVDAAVAVEEERYLCKPGQSDCR
jgi:hypothetical protein